LLSLEGEEVGLDGIVLVEFGFDVVVDVLEFLGNAGVSMCKGEFRRSKRTFVKLSISSPSGLSVLYRTLFQMKLLK
jgi:hypothetical protein